jgi:hypothetical protein
MPTRKTAKPSAKKAAYKPGSPIVALYSVPIYAAIKRGNLAEMTKLATQARKHISEVTAALGALEKKLGASPGLKKK